jgi:hypothetical protein
MSINNRISTETTDWTPEMKSCLRSLYYKHGPKWTTIGQEMCLRAEQVRSYWRKYIDIEGKYMRLEDSPYPRYDQPLTMEGNALIIPDLELPFHNAEFVNRVLDLAQAWGIEQCIMAGDMLHFDSLSGWQPNWQKANGHGGLDDGQEQDYVDFALSLRSKKEQERAFALLEKIGRKEEDGDPNLSEEMRVVRKATKVLAQCFKQVYVIVGNHEGRFLTTLNTPLFPAEITRMIDAKEWKVAPFYFSYLISGGEKYIIEHPKSAAIATAEKLASKYQCHTIVGHSHLLRFSWDISGKFYAITTGCAVDESRLPYAAQRHTNSPAHANGATIVRDGFPYLLHTHVDWNKLRMMG